MPKGVWGDRGKPAKCHPERKNVSFGLCSRCANKKYYAEQYKDKPLSTRKQYNLSKYKLTYDEYNQILISQNNACAICGSNSPRQGRAIFFCVDHNHDTGEIRGLLCGPCNRGIGYLKDDPDIVQKAYNYLKGSKIGEVKR